MTPWLLLLRIAGALLLGPHMYFVGRHRRRVAYQEMMLERRYQAATEAEAQQIFREHMEARLAKVVQEEEAAAAAASRKAGKSAEAQEREKARRAMLLAAPYTLSIPGLRPFTDKYPSLPVVESAAATALQPLGAKPRGGRLDLY